MRIVDESGEDYLYHKDHFAFVDFPPAVKKKILALESVASQSPWRHYNLPYSTLVTSSAIQNLPGSSPARSASSCAISWM